MDPDYFQRTSPDVQEDVVTIQVVARGVGAQGFPVTAVVIASKAFDACCEWWRGSRGRGPRLSRWPGIGRCRRSSSGFWLVVGRVRLGCRWTGSPHTRHGSPVLASQPNLSATRRDSVPLRPRTLEIVSTGCRVNEDNSRCCGLFVRSAADETCEFVPDRGELVVHRPAASPGGHDSGFAQRRQVSGHGAERHTEYGRQL